MQLRYVKSIKDIPKYSGSIPQEALMDVKSRLGDYALSNKGETSEGYILQQLRYLDNIVKAVKTSK